MKSKYDLTVHQIQNEIDILDFELLDEEISNRENSDLENLKGQIEGLKKALAIIEELK